MASSHELRRLFLNYFKEKGHSIIPSSSLIPSQEDHSLFFINAGMVPFKPIFAGEKPAPYVNIASIQRCLRAGGKHNDLDNVGYTARHHTFFEMLGNFSFGGYFKREAIQLAFDFLTRVLKILPEKLWITVYQEDKETADIWLNELKVDPERFSYCGKADNFWMMGESGPCGPCTEIFYDHGPTVPGGPPGSSGEAGDRYVEIWNLVFMQYDRQPEGELLSLPQPCVDTGMGLERLAAVMQGVVSNYDTDLFQPLIKAAAQLMPQVTSSHTLPVIADHIRAIGFLIMDGIIPSNEGRGYVLRRIIRRALRHGYQTGIREPFLYRLIPGLVDQMGKAYPDLRSAKEHIHQILRQEEEQFLRTLHHGMQYFEKALVNLTEPIIPGNLVFKLYDTYGFPPDLTADLACEHGLLWDELGFKTEMAHQKRRSQAAHRFSTTAIATTGSLSSTFNGYTQLNHTSRVIGLLDKDNQPIQQLLAGERGSIILEETPFYAESGGQVGDQGELWLKTDMSPSGCFSVLDTQKQNTTYLHSGYVKQGKLRLNDIIHAQVDDKRRQAVACHHSATHLLHAALRELLGTEITQKGSLVTFDYLRFDFHCRTSLTESEITCIEHRVNQAIWDNLPVRTQVMALEEAKAIGAVALFDEKYAAEVRVLSMGDFSTELCGGTHVSYTGEIGYFIITLSVSIAANVKRIEAMVGESAFQRIKRLEQEQNALCLLFKTNPEHLIARAEKQIALTKQQVSDITDLQSYLCRIFVRRFSKRVIQVGETSLVVATIPYLIAKQAREIIEQLKSYLPSTAVIVLGCQLPESVAISIGVSKQYTQQVNARDIVDFLAPLLEGKGGGRPDFAQIQSKSGDKNKLYLALKAVKPWLQTQRKTGIGE